MDHPQKTEASFYQNVELRGINVESYVEELSKFLLQKSSALPARTPLTLQLHALPDA